MSVYVSKRMTCCDGRSMQEIVGKFVEVQPIFRYGKNRQTGNFEVQEKELLAINLLKLAPFMCKNKKRKDKRKGFIVKSPIEYKEELMRQGFRLIKLDGETENYGCFSKPYNKKVLRTLYTAPVNYSDESLFWCGNYKCDERIDKAISRRFPELTFEVVKQMETDVVEHYLIRNGQIIENIE